MKRISVCLLVVVLSTIAHAQINWYSGTVYVQEGDSYNDNVFAWNDTVVEMEGGMIQSIDLFNTSRINISDGSIMEGLSAWNSSTVEMSGGNIVWYMDASDSSTVYLTGGNISDWLYATDSSVVNIFGYGFNYNPAAGNWNGGQLTGFWEDTTPFSIDLLDIITVDSTYYGHVILTEVEPIPEPTTLILLALGGLMVRRRR